ncbi:UPF0175 family protein [Candidatus Oscillochloris fontis]|uniref:UPF0175 family protein n=1 Tax=Candidatus Oscillochloris fontis TaxID=2496868 RepID=UPI00101C03D0|nr:UPF0175 family protein [Candidatus Oscillochloris fontis]
MTMLQIEYPEELLEATAQSRQELEGLAREALFIRLYDLGKLSSGKASELLGISRREFLDLLGIYGVSAFDDTQDVVAEAKVAIDARLNNCWA